MIASTNNNASALSLGLQGYQNGQQKVTEAAAEIASRPSMSNINASAVELTAGALQAQASAKVIDKADEMIGTLINTIA